jgi:hypothetical protein
MSQNLREMKMNINPARTTMIVWLVITLLAIFGIFAPGIFGMDGFDGGFAISTVCVVLGIIGLVVVWMYSGRAKALDGILRGEKILVHWKYSSTEWQQYADKAYKKEKQDKWQLYLMVVVISVIVGFGFWLFNRDSAAIVFFMLLGLFAFLAVLIFFSTNSNYWQNKKYQGEVYIAHDGAYVNRQLHLWRSWGAQLENVNYAEKEKLLEFTYSVPSRQGRDSFTLRVPVPDGEEKTARKLLEHFNSETAEGNI